MVTSSPKILCITNYHLDRMDCGAVVRSLNTFRLLGKFGKVSVVWAKLPYGEPVDESGCREMGGFKVAMVAQLANSPPRGFRERLNHEFNSRYLDTHAMQASPRDTARLAKLVADHDLVWIHGLRAANCFNRWHWPSSVMDLDDIMSEVSSTVAASAATLAQRWRCRRQATRWRARERRLMERFDAVCVCTPADHDTLARVTGMKERLFVLPNGFQPPADVYERRAAEPPRVGFIGSFHHEPNRSGFRWFLDSVWPQILEAVPVARLRVVGPGSLEAGLGGYRNVEPLGWVEDAAAEMATWNHTVVPIFSGGGTRIKTVEAFSRKCPVVSSTLGVVGYRVENGREALIADRPEDFSRACLELLRNPRKGEQLAESAWKAFLSHWTWDCYQPRVEAIVKHAIGPAVAQSKR